MQEEVSVVDAEQAPGAVDAVAETFDVMPEVRSFCAREFGAFVDGAMAPSKSDRRLAVFDPATGRQIATVANSGREDVEAAVGSAHAAFSDARWSGMLPAQRERILLRLADLIEAHGEELAQLETLEQGKSINLSRAIEVGAGAAYTRYGAGLATKITGRSLDVSIPMPPGTHYTAYTRREPLGVVAGITPWNFPLMIALWKVVPSLAAGNTIVLKPSESTPLSAFRLAELAIEAGVPAGVFNVVSGAGAGAGAALVAHPKIAKISFTGSTATGKAIGRAAIDTMAKTSLELGGMNPLVVFEDADFGTLIPGIMTGAFFNQGQVCASVGRVLVQRGIVDKLTDALAGATAGMTMGPGLDPSAQINPLASRTHQAKVESFLEDARAGRARIIDGGQRAPDANGYYVAPALVVDPPAPSRLRTEEVFGPVLTILPFDSEEEAVALANETPFGLAASVWTERLSRAMNLIPRIQAGTVWVNSHVFIDPNMPFGGFKQSGIGRDFGPDWLDAYTQLKSVCIAH